MVKLHEQISYMDWTWAKYVTIETNKNAIVIVR